jgi:hypothetical protein
VQNNFQVQNKGKSPEQYKQENIDVPMTLSLEKSHLKGSEPFFSGLMKTWSFILINLNFDYHGCCSAENIKKKKICVHVFSFYSFAFNFP